jgi:Na+-transporting methylmalonyl-CoA/oxaloacetate decarboxylase gamma subunit
MLILLLFIVDFSALVCISQANAVAAVFPPQQVNSLQPVLQQNQNKQEDVIAVVTAQTQQTPQTPVA